MSQTAEPPAAHDGPISVENVPCPACGAQEPKTIARGPDYDHHCAGDQEFTLAECQRCGFAYLNPRPTTAMLPVIYNTENYVCYGYTEDRPMLARGTKRYEDARARAIRSEAASVPNAEYRVLDIGAGEGRSLVSFAELGVPMGNLYAVDISEEVLAPLKARGMQTVCSRAEDLDLPAGTFDLIMMNQVIEHVADPRTVMQIAHRLLKPGGVLMMETPNMAGWDRSLFGAGLWGGYHFPRHWVLFSGATMTRMLQETGFTNIRILDISAAFVWSWNLGHLLQWLRFPERWASAVAPHNYAAMVVGALIDAIPRRLFRSSNMRALGRKP